MWIAIAAGCGDNDAVVPSWQGGEVLAYTGCAYTGTAIVQVAVDDTSVYWAGGCGGALYKTSLAGGVVTVLASGPNWCVDAVQLHDDRVYFGTGCASTIAQVPVTGGAATQLLSTEQDAPYACVHSIAQASEGLYVTTSHDVQRVGYDGATPSVIADQRISPGAIGVASDGIYWIEEQQAPAPTVFVGNLTRASRPDGGDPGLVVDADEFSGVAVTDTAIVYSESGSLWRRDPDHSTWAIAPITGVARDIHIDGDTVYWIDDGTVAKVDLHGGPMTVIARTKDISTTLTLLGLAVDATRVYWTTGCGIDAAAENKNVSSPHETSLRPAPAAKIATFAVARVMRWRCA